MRTLSYINFALAAIFTACCFYQAVFAVHEDKPHLHIHLVFNSVSYVDGSRFGGKYADFFPMRDKMRQILRDYGLPLRYVYTNDAAAQPTAI